MEFIDFLTVVICTIIYFFLEFLWRSKYFFQEIEWRNSPRKMNKWQSRIGRLIASFFLVFFVAFFENYLQVVHFWDGIIAGAICALGMIIPTHFFSFLRGSKQLSLFLLDSVSSLVNLMIIGGILAG
jgi:hypothetical protein